MVVFFQELEATTSFSDTDMQLALRLREAVVRVSGIPKGYSQKAWAKEFALLNRLLGDPDRIKQVTNWFCTNIGKQYTPVALSAGTFRSKFPQIEMAMLRDLARNPQLEISQQANDLHKTIQRFPWGNAILTQLPATIQKTLNEHRKSLAELQPFLVKEGAVKEVASRVKVWLGSSNDFTLTWFKNRAKSFGQWRAWSGEMLPLSYLHGGHEFIAAVLNQSRLYEHRIKTGVLILNQMGIEHGS